MGEFISKREFARRCGVSDGAVRKAISSGKITKGYDAEKGIDFDVAISEWGKAYVHSPSLKETIKNNVKKPIKPSTIPRDKKRKIEVLRHEDPEDIDHGEDVDAPIKISNSAEVNEAKRVEAVLKARLSQLELEEKKGKLVDKNRVYKELYALGQEVRSSMQGIPDKYIDNILACGSRAEAHSMLYSAISEALESFTKKIDV